MGTMAEDVAAHVAIKRMIHKGDFWSPIGAFIQLGTKFLNIGMDQIREMYIPWVTTHLEGCLPNCILPYATAMWFSKQVTDISSLHWHLSVNVTALNVVFYYQFYKEGKRKMKKLV